VAQQASQAGARHALLLVCVCDEGRVDALQHVRRGLQLARGDEHDASASASASAVDPCGPELWASSARLTSRRAWGAASTAASPQPSLRRGVVDPAKPTAAVSTELVKRVSHAVSTLFSLAVECPEIVLQFVDDLLAVALDEVCVHVAVAECIVRGCRND
jgi:hypothetical protein